MRSGIAGCVWGSIYWFSFQSPGNDCDETNIATGWWLKAEAGATSLKKSSKINLKLIWSLEHMPWQVDSGTTGSAHVIIYLSHNCPCHDWII